MISLPDVQKVDILQQAFKDATRWIIIFYYHPDIVTTTVVSVVQRTSGNACPWYV